MDPNFASCMRDWAGRPYYSFGKTYCVCISAQVINITIQSIMGNNMGIVNSQGAFRSVDERC